MKMVYAETDGTTPPKQAKPAASTKLVFKIKRPDEETMVFLVNGKEVGEANHDNDGWAGMDTARSLFERIAHAVGAKIVSG